MGGASIEEPEARRLPSNGSTPAPDLHALFAEVAEGRPQALEGIYDACSPQLFGLALWRTGSPADAADVVQDVFVRIARERSRLREVRDPRAWLFRVTHALSIDVHRRRQRRPEHPVEECAYLEAADASPERQLDARRASALLPRISAEQREALYLHHAGCTFAEVGKATGVPTFTAASRYRLGLRRLRALLGVSP